MSDPDAPPSAPEPAAAPPSAPSQPEAGPAAAPPAAAPPAVVPAAVAPASPDVAPVGAESALPGVHRGGFTRPPTAPVDLSLASAGAASGTQEPMLLWAPPEPAPPRTFAPWALGFSITGLVFSFFVGWGFPLGLVGIVSAIVALRRPVESRRVAVWALVLGILSLAYSAIWLYYAWTRAQLLA